MVYMRSSICIISINMSQGLQETEKKQNLKQIPSFDSKQVNHFIYTVFDQLVPENWLCHCVISRVICSVNGEEEIHHLISYLFLQDKTWNSMQI